jgi:hypothetical protein
LGLVGAARFLSEKQKTPPPSWQWGEPVSEARQHPTAALHSRRALISSSPMFTSKFMRGSVGTARGRVNLNLSGFRKHGF